jgi:hypothetical protein
VAIACVAMVAAAVPVACQKTRPAGAEKIALSAQAAAAIKSAFPKATLGDVVVENEIGMDLFKAQLARDGMGIEVLVAPDGTIVEVERETDVKRLPKVLAAAVAKVSSGAESVKVMKEEVRAEMTGGKLVKLAAPRVVYAVKMVKAGVSSEVFLAPDGSPAGSGAAATAAEAPKAKMPAAGAWRRSFKVNKANLVSTGENPYFIPLKPGYRLTLEAGATRIVITVLDETKVVDGVETRIIEERETEAGQLAEISRNYFAIDRTTQDVYYFGEDVDDYSGGKVTGHGGAWWSGVQGAKFGLMMPGRPKVGDKYYQEVAPGVAMDRAEIVAIDEPYETPAGMFAKCLRTLEDSPLESGTSEKRYALGVGLIKDDELVLVKVEP